MKIIKNGNTESGFTMLEVLVSLFIVAIVMGLVFTSLFLTTASSKDLIITGSRYNDLMKTYFQMRKQLLCLYESPNSDFILKELPTTQEKGDSLVFVTSEPSVFRGVVEAQYEIRKDKNKNQYLAYREMPYPGYKLQETGTEDKRGWTVLSGKITGLNIDYSSGNLWFTDWDKQSYPEKIRVTLYYKDGKIDKKFSFTVVPSVLDIAQSLGVSIEKEKEKQEEEEAE
ncbi:MAG: type II secretion system protein [Armatimonadota bacterium]